VAWRNVQVGFRKELVRELLAGQKLVIRKQGGAGAGCRWLTLLLILILVLILILGDQQASLSCLSVQEDMQQVVESPMMSRRFLRCGDPPPPLTSCSVLLTPLRLLLCRCSSKSKSSPSSWVRLAPLSLPPCLPLLQMIPSMWISWSPHSFTLFSRLTRALQLISRGTSASESTFRSSSNLLSSLPSEAAGSKIRKAHMILFLGIIVLQKSTT